MKSKLEQYNQSFKKALGQIIYKLIPDVPQFSVTDVLIDPSLLHGRVWIRSTKVGFSKISEKRVAIQGQLKNFVKTRYTPKLEFVADDSYLDSLDQLFGEIQQEEKTDA